MDLSSVLHTLPFLAHTPNSFRVSPCSQLQSYSLTSEAWVLAPSPCRHHQICITGWGVQWGGPDHLSVYLVSVLPAVRYLLHSPLSLWSSLSVLPDLLADEWEFPGWGNLSPFTAPSQGHFRYFRLIFSILLKYMVIILATMVVWDPLSPFSRYSMRTVSHVKYLWCIYGSRWALYPLFLPPSSLHLNYFRYNFTFIF